MKPLDIAFTGTWQCVGCGRWNERDVEGCATCDLPRSTRCVPFAPTPAAGEPQPQAPDFEEARYELTEMASALEPLLPQELHAIAVIRECLSLAESQLLGHQQDARRLRDAAEALDDMFWQHCYEGGDANTRYCGGLSANEFAAEVLVGLGLYRRINGQMVERLGGVALLPRSLPPLRPRGTVA